MSIQQPPGDGVLPVNRWLQLVAGVVCMVMIANLQYGWTYFVDPIDARFHWGRASIQVAFTIFVATETWLVPVEGWFVDRFGPRIVVMFGGVVPGPGGDVAAAVDRRLARRVPRRGDCERGRWRHGRPGRQADARGGNSRQHSRF